ncbi:MAG: CoA transferase [Thalassovita sp.]
MPTSPVQLPLTGLKVLDFAQLLAGPAAALRLADLGAEVVKIERPKGGDLCRSLVINDQTFEGDSLLFHAFNRNKQSVAADLKDPLDLDRVKELIASADVMIHNFRPGVMDRIGLDYDTVHRLNPRLVYGVVTGYGDAGPWRDKPGQDLLIQAMSGLTWLSGNADHAPVPTGLPLLDVQTGANLVQGILAALLRRGMTGQGGLVEVDMMSCALDLQFEQLTAYLNDDKGIPPRSAVSNANVYGTAPYGIYATKDGYLALAMTPLERLETLLPCPELSRFAQDQAFAERDVIKAVLADLLRSQSTQHWLDRLEPADIWCAKVMTWAELEQTDGFAALKPVQTITTKSGFSARTTRCPIRIDGHILTSPVGAPALGADTETYFPAAETELS